MSRAKVRQYLVKLKLIEMGEIAEVERLDGISLPSAVFEAKDGVPKPDLEHELRLHEERYEAFIRMNRDRSVDTRTSMEINNMVEAFKRAISSIRKCENCKAYSPSLRKDGFAKLFEKPLQQKMAAANSALEMKLKSALEEVGSGKRSEAKAMDVEEDGVTSEDELDSSSDADSDVQDVPQRRGKPAVARPTKVEAKAAAAAASSADKYLAPIEVEARMRLLWKNQGEILDFIWTRALMRKKSLHANHRALKEAASKAEQPSEEVPVVDGGSSSDAWKMFFMRCVLVPPSRFRPAADMGEMKVEHAQNITLAKVLQNNEKIKNLMAGVGASNNDALDEATMKKVDMSRIVSTWIDLQNEVNCYMDSAKDPNPLGSSAAPPGIRQLLERKEGLFRKNMMGKRVNFCCRSVISPDPFIGTNEVGIPVIFAKELHFPAPVTPWNVKYLRKLVENGPNIYPGKPLDE
jgi:DNA-directed RNA polymerase I subunit RPA1